MSESTPESNVPETEAPETTEETTKETKKSSVFDRPVEKSSMRSKGVRRMLILIVLLIGIVYGFLWFVGLKGDIVLPIDSSNLIGAIKLQDQGSQVVAIDPDGKITESKGYVAGKSDRDLAWDPNGNRLFFISDRKDESFHIFRWNPKANDNPDQKSIDKAGRSSLVFDAQDNGKGELSALVVVRGTVQEFFPKTAQSKQIMPPTKKTAGGEEEGSSGTFELIYKRYGQSFRMARWFKLRRFIAAVMKREDKGEALIVQDTELDEKNNIRPPVLLMIAEKINITVDPKSGNLIVVVLDIFPTMNADGKLQKYPFNHGLFICDPESDQLIKPIGVSTTAQGCFASPVPSPDGNSLMFLAGKYLGDGNIDVQGLLSCPLTPDGLKSTTPIVQGNVIDPTFNADGSKIAYIKQEGNRQAVFIASSTGGDAKNLTGTSGDFAHPLFSPQYK